MFDGEYTHEGDRCTFEVMIKRFGLHDRGLFPLAEIIHDIDLKDTKYGRVETDGFKRPVDRFGCHPAGRRPAHDRGDTNNRKIVCLFPETKGEMILQRL